MKEFLLAGAGVVAFLGFVATVAGIPRVDETAAASVPTVAAAPLITMPTELPPLSDYLPRGPLPLPAYAPPQPLKAEWWGIEGREGSDYTTATCQQQKTSPAEMYEFWKYEQPRIVDHGDEVQTHHIEGGKDYLLRYFKSKAACDAFVQNQRASLDKYR